MSDPRRWLEGTRERGVPTDVEDEAGGARGERDLLRAGLSMDPPAGQQDRVWAALMAQIGPGPGGDGPGGDPGGPVGPGLPEAGAGAAAGAAKAAGGALAWAGVVKSMLLGGAGAALFVASYAAVTPAPMTEAPASPAEAAMVEEHAAPARAAAAGQPAPVAEERSPDPAPGGGASRAPAPEPRGAGAEPRPHERAAHASPAPAEAPAEAPAAAGGVGALGAGAPGDVAAAERASRLREESRLLAEARAALRRGDAGGALRLIQDAQARFPGGALGQEREALAIEALAQAGQRAAASARAAAFLRAWPGSPHATRVQAFLQP